MLPSSVTSASSNDPSNKHRVALRGVFSSLPVAVESLARCHAFISDGVPCGSVTTSAISIFTSYNGWMSRDDGIRRLFDAYVTGGYIAINEAHQKPLSLEWAVMNGSFDTVVALLEHGADERLVPSSAYIATVPTKNEDGSSITLKPIRDVFDFIKIECSEIDFAAPMAAAIRANAMRRRIEAATADGDVAAPQRRLRSL